MNKRIKGAKRAPRSRVAMVNSYKHRQNAFDVALTLQDAKPGWDFTVQPNPEGGDNWAIRAERTIVEINEMYKTGDVGHMQVVWMKINGTITFPEVECHA